MIASQQKLADAFTDSGQIQGGVNFADYTDKRYNEALTPYFVAPQQP